MKKASGIVVVASGAAALAIGYAIWSHAEGLDQPWAQVSEAGKGGAGGGIPLAVAAMEAARPVPVEPAKPPTPLVVTVPAAKAPTAWLQSAASLPADGAALARELQRELQRVGCYEGALDGVWTPATRGAMKAFTEAVNATLPSDQPDSILLSLAQGHQGRACGGACPDGQGLAADGRCLPNASLAKAPKKAAEPTATAAPDKPSPTSTPPAVVASTPPAPSAEGQVAPAGATADVTPAAVVDGNGETAVVAPPGPAAAPAARPQRRTISKRPAGNNVGWGLFRQFERSGS